MTNYEPIGLKRCRPRNDLLARHQLRALRARVKELELIVARLGRPYWEREPPHCPSCDCPSDSPLASESTATPDSSASQDKP